MKIFIIGGAGYIGSHMAKAAHNAGHEIVTIDNLSTGHKDSVLYGKFELCDILETKKLENLFIKHKPDAVMHFASFSLVGESKLDPCKYYQNNVSGTLSLLKVMNNVNCKKLVFSSSASIFGNPISIPIDEKHPKDPINPYGRSKLMIEQILNDFNKAYGLKYISLRYFNAAGNDNEGELREKHDPETHLLPLVMSAANNKHESFSIFGNDYDTKDGTCVRDFVYVEDLTKIHLESLNLLFKESFQCSEFNIGTGIGYSVKEIISEIEAFTGKKISIIYSKRRPGDPPVLISDGKKLLKELNSEIEFSDLKKIIKTL